MKIVSGGQTGVDRAALDTALALGLPHGGWCPRGRMAEDGRIDPRYPLRETDSWQYPVRTEQNVIDADATLILCAGELRGGTELTYRMTCKHRRPCLQVDLDHPPTAVIVAQWLRECRVETLNVAGPRESQSPGVYQRAGEFLRAVLEPLVRDAAT